MNFIFRIVLLCYSAQLIGMAPIIYNLSNGKIIELRTQDITTMNDVDVIVNAANANLAAGGGVCGAIYATAGVNDLTNLVSQSLQRAGKSAPIPVGQAILSGVPPQSKLAQQGIKGIIHAVGPDCRIQTQRDNFQVLLENAYANSLTIATLNSLNSIAFPSISTAIFACDPTKAATIASRTILSYFTNNPGTSLQKIVLVFFDPTQPMNTNAVTRFKIEFDKILATTKFSSPTTSTGTNIATSDQQLVVSLNTLEQSLNNLATTLGGTKTTPAQQPATTSQQAPTITNDLANIKFEAVSVLPIVYFNKAGKLEKYVIVSREAAGNDAGTWDAFGGSRDSGENHPVITGAREFWEEAIIGTTLGWDLETTKNYIDLPANHTTNIIVKKFITPTRKLERNLVVYLTEFPSSDIITWRNKFYDAKNNAVAWKFKEKDGLASIRWDDLVAAIKDANTKNTDQDITLSAREYDLENKRDMAERTTITLRPVLVKVLRPFIGGAAATVGNDPRILLY